MDNHGRIRKLSAAAGLGLLLGFSIVLTGCTDSAAPAGTEAGPATEKIVEAIPAEELAAIAEETAPAAGPKQETADTAEDMIREEVPPEEPLPAGSAQEEADPEAEASPAGETEEAAQPETTAEASGAEEPEQPAEPAAPVQQAAVTGQGRIVVLDPGHSANIPSGSEPLGPGSAETKSKDTVGTRGTATGLMEYELVFNVCLALQNELTARGYTVLMTRSSNSDSVSCMQRAETANNAGAAVFLRVHADGAESASAHGASVLCISAANPYTASTYSSCRKLSDCVISSYCAATGCYNRGVFETDQMSGNNWSRVPTTLIELGFMTNPEEDTRMASADYQALMVQGMANGIDAYFASITQ